jgi:ankyrin repeat protein
MAAVPTQIGTREEDGGEGVGWNGHFEVVDLLLKTHTVDVNWRSPDGRSPLFCTVERNSEDIAVLLLENGANSKLANSKGVTPLELIEQDERLEMDDIFEKV